MGLLRFHLVLWLALLMPAATAAETRNLSAQTVAARRMALVIGNDSYQKVDALKNARADARAIAKALEATGFAVTLRLDLTEKATKEAVRRFKTQIGGGDEAVFYFSGHGVQLGGANYLLPVDIAGESEEQVKDEALPLQRVLDDLQEQKARFSLAIIDACRNNPFKGTGRSIGGRGLAPTSAATGQMVLFAAGTNQQALDQLGPNDRTPNGLFTRVLLKQMAQPGVSVDRVLRGVRDEVVRLARSVGHEQVPALYDQAIGDFYFRPTGGALPAGAPADTAAELAFWDTIKSSTDVEDFQAYLARYPGGQFVALAERRVNRKPAKADDAAAIASAPAALDAGNPPASNAPPTSAVASATTGKSMVIFLRNGSLTSYGVDAQVIHKEGLAGVLASGAFFKYETPIGDQTFYVNQFPVKIKVEANRTYFVQVTAHLFGTFSASLIGEDAGNSALGSLRNATIERLN